MPDKKGVDYYIFVNYIPTINKRNTPFMAAPVKVETPNIHPADELAAVREEIKVLTARADELRDTLLEEDADLKGDQYTANIIPGVRETLDKKALIETFGAAFVEPFIKKTQYQTVKLIER